MHDSQSFIVQHHVLHAIVRAIHMKEEAELENESLLLSYTPRLLKYF